MDAPRTTALDDTLLIFAIHGIRCGVPAQSVDTIVMPPPYLTHPPGSNRTRPGIFAHNGQVHGVVDLREAFGLSDGNSSGRLLLYHFGELHYAFVVDEVVGLVRSEEGQWAPLPPDLPRKTFTRGFLHQQQIVLCSDFPRLLRLEDGEPLRHHFAAVVAARNTVTTTPTTVAVPLTPAIAATPPVASVPQAPVSASPRPALAETHAPPLPAATRDSPPPKPRPSAAPPRRSVTRPALRTAPTIRPATNAPVARPGQRPLRASPPPAPRAEASTESTPSSPPADRHRWAPLALALPLLLALGAGVWFWPASEPPAASAPPLLALPRPQPTPPAAEPLQPLRIEKGRGGLTLIVEESALNTTANEASAPAPVPREVRRIVHRVKRGDTLWGIAERYVHNPWRFRELAHQSGIDNPNLIYPGDEVTILIR